MADIVKLRPPVECDWSKGLDFTEFPDLDAALDRYDSDTSNSRFAGVQLHQMADRIREWYGRRVAMLETELVARRAIDEWLRRSNLHGLSFVENQWCAFVYDGFAGSPVRGSAPTLPELADKLCHGWRK